MTTINPQFIQAGHRFINLNQISLVKYYPAREAAGVMPARPETIEINVVGENLVATAEGTPAADLLHFFEDYSFPVIPEKE
jgi:hypothetical protein